MSKKNFCSIYTKIRFENFKYKNAKIETPEIKKYEPSILKIDEIIGKMNFEKALEEGNYKPNMMYKVSRNNIQINDGIICLCVYNTMIYIYIYIHDI